MVLQTEELRAQSRILYQGPEAVFGSCKLPMITGLTWPFPRGGTGRASAGQVLMPTTHVKAHGVPIGCFAMDSWLLPLLSLKALTPPRIPYIQNHKTPTAWTPKNQKPRRGRPQLTLSGPSTTGSWLPRSTCRQCRCPSPWPAFQSQTGPR